MTTSKFQHALVSFLLVSCALLLASVPPARAVPVGNASFVNESNPNGDFCVAATFDNATDDVFGTLVNLGTDVVGMLCIGHFDPMTGVTAHCTSTPDNSKFSFDATTPPPTGSASPQVGAQQPYVGAAPNPAGSVATAIGSVTYTFDGVQTLQPDPNNSSQPEVLPANDISGCPVVGPVVIFLGNVGINAFRSVSTDTGSQVAVGSTATFTDQATGTQRSADVAVTFDQVTGAGTTTITATSSVAGQLDANFSVNIGGLAPLYIDVSTTATIIPPITVCQHYPDDNNDGLVDGTGVAVEDLRVLHGEGSNPIVFHDRTVLPVDTANKLVCASVSSLSPFVLAVNVASTSTHDTVVAPVAPLKVTIPKTKTTVSKPLSLKVLNADLTETAGHEIQLAVTGSTCPAALLQDTMSHPVAVDFDAKTSGAQSSIVVLGGKSKVGKLPLNVRAQDFTSPNAKSPARCTLTLTASAVTSDTVIEPNPSNNQVTVDIEVIDKNDFP
ncbi:MAG TPA: hypothetical protein VMT89_16750 [Candidatus Acidoferrales bacterium]|nr:hypothetical protein [Candidatus Acidoferrales bacterium]